MSDYRINGLKKWNYWHNWISDVKIKLVTIELMAYKNEIIDIIELVM
jgi:hypothetical protein